MMVSRIVGTIALGMLLVGSLAYAGVDPGELCKEKKDKAAGKKAFDLLKAFGKNTKKPNDPKLAQDVSKAQSKFTKGFSKAEAVGGGACPFVGDAADVEQAVDDAVAEILSLIRVGPPTTTTTTTSTTTSTTTTTIATTTTTDGNHDDDKYDDHDAAAAVRKWRAGRRRAVRSA